MKIDYEYKDSGVPWIGEVPKDWQIPVLKRTTYIKGRIGWQGLTSEEYRNEGTYHLVTGTDFDSGKIRWERCWYVDEARYSEDENIQLCEDDVLITKDGTIGKIAIVEYMPFRATLNSGVFVTRPFKKQYLQRFMFWVLNSDLFPEFIEYSKVGTTIAHLYQKTFEKFIYPLPSLSEQHRIAAYLDKACSAIDATIETKRKQLKTLDALRKSIIHKAVTRGLDDSVELKDSGVEWLGEIPRHWKVQRIKHLSEILRGKFSHRPRNDPRLYNGPYPFIQTGDVSVARKYIEVYQQTLNDDGFKISKQFPRGTLTMTIAANVGDVAILDFEACFPDSIVGFYPHHNVDIDYLYYLFTGMREALFSAAVLSIQLNLNIVRIGSLSTALPPISEQRSIAAYLDGKCANLEKLDSNIEQQIDTLEQYRKSLIHECVTGKRRITENDLKQIGVG
jgi:type I restriction enzyme S subunit